MPRGLREYHGLRRGKEADDGPAFQEIYYDLENTLPVIYNDYYAYTENLELFSPSMTNMRYFVIPKSVTEVSPEDFSKKICTNMKSFGKEKFSSQDGLLDYIRTSYKDYLIYDSSDMNYEANGMPISLSELSSYVKSYSPSVEGDYILVVAVVPGIRRAISWPSIRSSMRKSRR